MIPNMSKTLTPRQKERRARILRTARELINEAGYAGMTTRELAARAEVSATTLFNLYNTKEELLLAALREQLGGMNTELDEVQPAFGWERIVSFHDVIASQAERTPAYAKAIVHALLQAAPGDALVRILIGNFQQEILQSLRNMKDKKQLNGGASPEDLAATLVGTFWGTQMLWDKGLVDNARLRRMSLVNCMSILAPAARGQAKKALEQRLAEI
jgi:AcrR family transcriptional regulator